MNEYEQYTKTVSALNYIPHYFIAIWDEDFNEYFLYPIKR